MNIFMILLIVFGGAVGIISSVGTIILLIGTIAFKIYRKIKYGISLYN